LFLRLKVVLLALSIAVGTAFEVTASEALLFALKKNGVTTIFLYNRDTKKISYPSLLPDNESQGEGESFFVSGIVIHDLNTEMFLRGSIS
jgi:hypothetical protein